MKCLLIGSAKRSITLLLAQEVTTLVSRIDNDDRQQRSHDCHKKHFHAHRIAWSPTFALYSEFANAKQKCNGYKIGTEKKNVLPCPSRLSTHIFPPWASMTCLAIDNPNPVPRPVLDLSTR